MYFYHRYLPSDSPITGVDKAAIPEHRITAPAVCSMYWQPIITFQIARIVERTYPAF